MAKRQIREYVFTPGVAGVGKIKVLDKIQLDTILLITNVTKNKILYNFSDSANQITVAFNATTDGSDPDFPYANTISNGVTELTLLFDTSDQDSTDAIQIFVEDEEVTFRPYNFGTDAIERMRVATPQSMLDADFEYGLQPTKWQTIDIMRGYPSIYEVPGSELTIQEITTNASSSTGGVGDSVLTVTTPQAHGFSVGTPVRIFGLNDSITGSSRAEGSFIVDTVLSVTSFSYYAKGKVGVTDGQSLKTSFSQLKKGDYYTGSSIGSPTFSIYSQGSNGSFLTNLITPSASNRISFTGVSTAQIGAPLTGVGVTTGSQITGIATNSTTKTLASDVISPTNTISLNDISGVEIGSAINNGIGTAVFVNNIVGNTLTLSAPILVNYTGSANELGNFVGTKLFGNGSGVLFDIDRIDGEYKVSLSKIEKSSIVGSAGSSYVVLPNTQNIKLGQTVIGSGIGVGATVIGFVGLSTIQLSIVNSGSVSGVATFTNIGMGYTVNDRIIINRTVLEGSSVENDLIVRVGSVNATGGITSITSAKQIIANGTPKISTAQFKSGSSSMLLNPTDGTPDYVSIASTSEFEFGTSDYTIDFWVYRNRTSVSEFLYDMRTTATQISPTIYISSSNFINYYVNGADRISGITTVSASSWYHVAVSREGTTTRLFVNGNLEGTYTDSNNYPERPVVVGARYDGVFGFYGYIDEVRVSRRVSRFTSAFDVNQVTFTNDVYNSLYLRFRGLNNSTTFSDDSKGIAISSSQFYSGVSGITTGSGINATFDVLRTGGASPSYSVTLGNPGTGYAVNDTIDIDGSVLGGISGTNNLIITVNSIDGSTAIVSVGFAGTASNGNLSLKAVGDTNISNSGRGALFNVSKDSSSYFVNVVNSGVGYYPEYQVKIFGTELGGTTPTNDLLITTDRLNIGSGTSLGIVDSVTVFGTPVVGSALTFYPAVTISEPTIQSIPQGTSLSFSSLAKIQADFPSKHGLVPGDTLLVSIASTGTNHQLASGPRIVDVIPNLNRLVFSARSAGTIGTTAITGTIYTRPDCFYVHRPFDGGVQLGTKGPAHGAHAIRQSKKYIRYQSGKGIMYTTGTLFAPAYDLRSITATGIGTGSVMTVVTDENEHGLQIGAEIILSNITTSGYNGNYIVNSIVNETTFTVLATQQLGSTNATLGTQAQVSLYKWKGATVRCGAFDDQNGIFWQYDGVNLAVGLRSATYQLAGTIAINTDSNAVTGTNTRFSEQLIVGNRIVIRGMTHIVTNIENNTTMTVTPDFRGVSNVSGVKAALVNEITIPQYQWNIDRADGTGPSGYEIEVNKMQMIGFQYSWYGAGFIDWMLRGPNGDYLFIHRLKNNNRNTEAFMRSGNLPVRYEVINEGAKTKLTQNVGVGSTQIYVDNVDFLPSSGSLYIDNEIINYTGIQTSTKSLTGITRAATFSNFYSGSQRSYTAGITSTHTANTGIVLLSNTATPVISHWGSAFLTDGLFDTDRGYIFNYQSVGITVSTTKNTAFLLRLAPSVSNALTGDLGQRELINRAQLLLQSIEFTPTGGSSTQGVVIEGILNPQNYPTNPANINWFSLTNAGVGGQPSFAQIANGSSVVWSGGGTVVTASNALTQGFTNDVYFTLASTVDVRIGMQISGTGVAGGTLVSGIFVSGIYRIIRFSQPVNPGSAGSTSYTFTAIATAAVPGETVFSFVGNGGGGNNASLDLTQLKELNNTPIGGRGTFPNGPDVLAINLYTTSGSPFTGSLVLRWGEAQA